MSPDPGTVSSGRTPAVINSPIIRSDATPLFITSAAHKTTVKAMIARTSWAGRVRPAGVGSRATAKPTTIAIASHVHLTVGLAAATAGGAATEVLIVKSIVSPEPSRVAKTERLNS